jgi:entericidin B
MVRKFFAVALIIAGIGVSACNTVQGAGKDVSSAGNAVAKAADDSK